MTALLRHLNGYYTDNETWLQLLTHRYYEPGQGRFLTRDPLGYGGGVNLYAYCQNDPVNLSDPSGLCPDSEGALYAQAWKAFKDDPEFAPGSAQRRQYSNFVQGVPVLGPALSGWDGLTGRDPLAGTDLTGGQRAWDAGATLLAAAAGLGDGMGGGPPSMADRLQMFFDQLGDAPAADSPGDALGQVRDIMNGVEDANSGVPYFPVPGPGMSNGRMYPPFNDRVWINSDGSLTAITRGHQIEFSPDGGINIFLRDGGGGSVFSKPGGGY